MKHILILLDIIICTCSYAGIYYFKTGSFIPRGEYLTLFWVYILLWLFFSMYYKMQKYWLNFTYRDFFISLLFTSAYTLFFLTLIVSLTDLSIVSRLFLIGIVATPFLIELPGITFIRRFLSINRTVLKNKPKSTIAPKKAAFRLRWLISGLIMLAISFIMINILKHGSFIYGFSCERAMLVLLSTWIISVGLTGKYKFIPTQNLYYQIAPFIKSGLIMFIMTGIAHYFFRLEFIPRLELFGTTLVYITLETFVFIFVFMGKSRDPGAIYKENVLDHGNGNIFGQEPLPVSSLTESTSEFAIDIQSLFKRISVKESGRPKFWGF